MYYVLVSIRGRSVIAIDVPSRPPLILVHADEDLAIKHIMAIAEDINRDGAVIGLECDRAHVREQLESYVETTISNSELIFPDNPIYSELMKVILRNSSGS